LEILKGSSYELKNKLNVFWNFSCVDRLFYLRNQSIYLFNLRNIYLPNQT